MLDKIQRQLQQVPQLSRLRAQLPINPQAQRISELAKAQRKN